MNTLEKEVLSRKPGKRKKKREKQMGKRKEQEERVKGNKRVSKTKRLAHYDCILEI